VPSISPTVEIRCHRRERRAGARAGSRSVSVGHRGRCQGVPWAMRRSEACRRPPVSYGRSGQAVGWAAPSAIDQPRGREGAAGSAHGCTKLTIEKERCMPIGSTRGRVRSRTTWHRSAGTYARPMRGARHSRLAFVLAMLALSVQLVMGIAAPAMAGAACGDVSMAMTGPGDCPHCDDPPAPGSRTHGAAGCSSHCPAAAPLAPVTLQAATGLPPSRDVSPPASNPPPSRSRANDLLRPPIFR
jgi:hypothetical protein